MLRVEPAKAGDDVNDEVVRPYPLKRLKHVVSLRRSRVDGIGRSGPYVGLENIESRTGKLLPGAPTTDADARQPPPVGAAPLSNTFERDDVLFGKLRPYLAKVWVAEFSGRCSTELLVMEPAEIDPGFLRYVCLWPEFVDAVDASTFGSKMPRADWNFIGNVAVPVPERSRQRAVCEYLDRETARLDSLVAETSRLLDLLSEKRSALIASMIAGYPTQRLKYVVSLRRSRIDRGEDDSLYVGLENIEPRTGKFINNLLASNSPLTNTFERDDVLFGKLRPYLAKAWVAEFRGRCSSELLVMEPVKIYPGFLRYVCLWSEFVDAVDASTFGSKMPRADWDFIGNVAIPVPERSEQRAVCKYLDRETEMLDSLMAETSSLLELLSEKRAALIAAVVTGKKTVGDVA